MSRLPFATGTVYWLPLVLWTGGLNAQTCLMLSPAAFTQRGTVVMDLTLYSARGAEPAAIQWTFQAPSSITSLTVDDGPTLTSAGKTAICSGEASAYRCMAVGASAKTIANGVIAKLTAAFGFDGAIPTINIVDAIGASASGRPVPILANKPPSGNSVSVGCPHSPPTDRAGRK